MPLINDFAFNLWPSWNINSWASWWKCLLSYLTPGEPSTAQMDEGCRSVNTVSPDGSEEIVHIRKHSTLSIIRGLVKHFNLIAKKWSFHQLCLCCKKGRQVWVKCELFPQTALFAAFGTCSCISRAKCLPGLSCEIQTYPLILSPGHFPSRSFPFPPCVISWKESLWNREPN